jgi:hypothetical protein
MFIVSRLLLFSYTVLGGLMGRISYNIGAFICFLISVGCAAIVYGGGLSPLVPLHLPAWIFGPLGVYTIVFAFSSIDRYFFLSWGSVLLSVAVASALFNIVNPFVVLGILLITLAVIGSIAYFKQMKKGKL